MTKSNRFFLSSRMLRLALLFLALSQTLLLGGCAASQPKNVENICDIFREKDGWYEDAVDSQERWGSGIPVMMAFVYAESKFIPDLKPARRKILWLIPGPRPTSAYGYPQAQDPVWEDYMDATENYGYDRDDFSDSIDFIGWYNSTSNKRLGIAPTDVKNLYFAYHEGQGGYKRQTHLDKPGVQATAEKVRTQTAKYSQQLAGCEKELQNDSKFLGIF